MRQGRAEVLPECSIRARIVGGEQQGEHEDQPKNTGRAHQDSSRKSDAYAQLAIRHQKGDHATIGQNEILEYSEHERVGAVLDEPVDPDLKSATESELRAKHFVLAENEKEYADRDP